MITNHQPLSASWQLPLPSILFFSFPAPLKPLHPFPSPPAYRFGIPPFPFRHPIQLGSTKPPTIRRSSPIRKPPVHSFVNPIAVWRTDLSFIPRIFESSQYLFLSQPCVYKAPCHDYPHANNSTKLEIFTDPPLARWIHQFGERIERWILTLGSHGSPTLAIYLALLLTENLLSTDSPSDNLAMMKQIPPRWEHVLFQGDPHSHNIETLERAKQVAVAREKLLGESHPKSIHSKVRLAWTCFYMSPTSVANSSEQFKKLLELKAPNENADRETVSYLAGIGWSEFTSENYDEAAKNFEKALEIQNQYDRLVDPDSLSYTVALAKVHLVQALIGKRTTGRKRKRTSTDSDVASPRSLVERALGQLHLSYNCQRFSPELGKNHPETAETMATLAYGYQVLARIRKGELVPTKVLKQYYQSAEIFLNEAFETTHMSLGDDHPHTLLSLHEVAHVDFMNGRNAERSEE